MMSKEERIGMARVSKRYFLLTRQARNKERENGVENIQLRRVLEFWPKVFVLVFSKILNRKYA